MVSGRERWSAGRLLPRNVSLNDGVERRRDGVFPSERAAAKDEVPEDYCQETLAWTTTLNVDDVERRRRRDVDVAARSGFVRIGARRHG